MRYELIRRLCLLMLAIWLSGCTLPLGGIEFIQETPVKLIAQHEQQIAFAVKKRHHYFFDLHFEFKDAVDRARVASLVGSTYRDRDGKSVNEGGVPMPVRLSIRRVERSGTQEVALLEVDPKPAGFTRRTMGKRIGGALLVPGRYVAVFTAQETVKEFDATLVEFVVSYDAGLRPPPP